MAKKIAARISLLVAVLLPLYFYYQHISVSWSVAQANSSVTSDTTSATLPTMIKPGQGRVWICPMHPEIMQDHPGKCPICGMDLVESKSHIDHGTTIQVDSAIIQKLGIRLAPVKISTVSREISTFGNVTADGSSAYNIHSNFEGWIKKSYIHSIGQKIEQGQVIYEIYSPELIMQQKGYLKFIERRDQILQSVGDTRFQENEYVMGLLQDLSTERTKFLRENIGLETVQRLEDSKRPIEEVKILAAESGVVTQLNAREGSFVTPVTTLFSLTKTAKVWIDITLYPDQVALAKVGDEVSARNGNGHVEKARLDFISPVAENNQVNARVTLNNAYNQLRPGSFVDVTIYTQPHEALVLPRSAVIYSGDGDRVMLSRGDGRFLPVRVETGIESGDDIEIVDGLREGAEVAVNGQFLLDAAASMSSAAERMHSGHHD